MRLVAKLILRLAGWKFFGKMPEGIKKSVIIMAPHTSYMDFVIGKLGLLCLNIKAMVIIKKEFFYFPLGLLLRALGCIPIDRAHSHKFAKHVAKMYNSRDTFHLLITPEGTRKLNHKWKRGFYFIAQKAKVPIICGYLDYGDKSGGLGPVVNAVGDFEKDFKKIEEFYKGKTARFPEKFNLSA